MKIKQELKYREISSPIIKLALTEINDEEYRGTLLELAHKKLQLLKEPNAYKKKKKLMDYLLQKGYESHLVYDTVSQLID